MQQSSKFRMKTHFGLEIGLQVLNRPVLGIEIGLIQTAQIRLGKYRH